MKLHPLTFGLLLLIVSGCIPKVPSDQSPITKKEEIIIHQPNMDCPSPASPTFSWQLINSSAKAVTYSLSIVEIKTGQDINSAFTKNEKVLEIKNFDSPDFTYSKRESIFLPNKAYAFQVSAFDTQERNNLLAKSRVTSFFIRDPKLPAFFDDLICCESALAPTSVLHWTTAYGTPSKKEKQMGCLNSPGVLEMKGNKLKGDAVRLELQPFNKITEDSLYQISFCVRSLSKQLDYTKVSLVAYNGSLPNNGFHPVPAENIAIIGVSVAQSSGDWKRIMLAPWKAPKDFSGLALLLASEETDESKGEAMGLISNICVQKVDDCTYNAESLGITSNGQLTEVAKNYSTPGTTPETSNLNYSVGSLNKLYGPPFDNTGNSNWYDVENDCVAIGGEIPDSAKDLAKEYAHFKLTDKITPEVFQTGMQNFYNKFGHKLKFPNWKPVPKVKEQNCRLSLDKSKPFKGRDIIYVHGLVLDHILKRTVARDQTGYLSSIALATNYSNATELSGTLETWPENEAAFFEGGFYHDKAKEYYQNHIQRHLGDVENPSNRYLIVAYNSSQRLIENVHTALTQIILAMNEGRGVKYDKKDPRGADCFGKEVVIISHSTGALLMDVALSLAARSGSDDSLRKFYGDIESIATRTKAHISLHGAIGGSELAALGVFGANLAAGAAVGTDVAIDLGIFVDDAVDDGAELFYDALTGLNTYTTTNNTSALEAFLDAASDTVVVLATNLAATINQSVLVDLSPIVAKSLWGSHIEAGKVPTLTVAGGHPGGISESLITKWLLPGFDDGVVSTNSQSGSPSFIHPELYQYLPPEPRIFHLGIDARRSTPYFAEQSKGILGAAYGSFPWVSPAGMVQPVLLVPSPTPRYNLHFPFLQSASEHMYSFMDTLPQLPYLSSLGAPNTEEILALESTTAFDDGLISEDITALVVRQIRGQDLVISLSFDFPVVQLWPPPPTITIQNFYMLWEVPLWRRTYDFINSSNQETDLVYKFVLR
jgi:hypothetical protein